MIIRSIRRTSWTAVTAVALALNASAAQAQGVAESFGELRLLVRAGDTVTVVEPGGVETKGRLVDLTASALTLKARGARRVLGEREIETVRQRYSDPLSNGALRGLGTGAALGGLAILLSGGADWGLAGLAAAFYGGIGTGIGAGIDAIKSSERVVYGPRRPSSPSVRVVPLLGSSRQGVVVSVGF